MERIKFKDGGTYRRGVFRWDMLKESPVSRSQTDIRFTLYNYTDKEVVAIMFDVDRCSFIRGLKLMEDLESLIGKVKIYQVHTGGGHHLYVPLKNHFHFDDVKNFKQSYKELVGRFSRMYPGQFKFDDETFNKQVYGRVPKAINSKWNTEVKYIKENDYPLLDDIEDILEYREVITHTLPEVANLSEYSPAEYCGVISYLEEHGEDAPYDVWKMGMATLAAVGDEKTAKRINKREDIKVEEWFRGGKKKYIYMCENVHKNVFKNSPDCPCHDCPHNMRGSSPSYVSGVLPTPYAHNQFHLQKMVTSVNEYGEKVSGMEILQDRVHTGSVVNHWVNLHQKDTLQDGKTFYRWSGTHWYKAFEYYKLLDIPRQLYKELMEIPRYSLFSEQDVDRLFKGVYTQRKLPGLPESFNNPDYINLKNGVLNMTDLKVYDHNKEYYMEDILEVSYDPDAQCTKWLAFLDETLGPEEQRLLQVFMGLAMSSVPNFQYQQYLWIRGEPGTGKSMILNLLQSILGENKYVSLSPNSAETRDGGVTFDYRGKTLASVDDFKALGGKWFTKKWEAFMNVMSTGSTVPIRRLYQDNIESRPTCTVIVTSNENPPAIDMRSGTLRRVRILDFYKAPLKTNPRLLDELKEERPGILNWMIQGLKYYFEHGMPPISKTEEADHEYMTEEIDDAAGEFSRRYLEADPHATPFLMSSLYERFLTYMEKEREMYSLQRFAIKIKPCLTALLRKHKEEIFRKTTKGMMIYGVKVKKGGDSAY